MKKILFTLASALLTFGFGFSQTTEIPDLNFEQALIDLGYDSGDPDGFVLTTNINLITELNVNNKSITDLTGIEGFTDLTRLSCYNNQLTSLNVSNNTALTYLGCGDNQLTILDVSNNTALTALHCFDNQLTSLNVSNNTALTSLSCGNNQLTILDVSNNTALTGLYCFVNELTSLNVRNGNNINFRNFDSSSNPNLTCIFVDDVDWSPENWTVFIDSASTFVANEAECSALSVVDYASYLDIFIHPNPTENHLFVQGHKNPISISISNLQGKKVLSKINVDKIDVSSLSKGAYFIKVSDGINSSTKKFIKN